jgi:hypothetical protein
MSDNFHSVVMDNCGDSDVITSQNKKVDPALKFYNRIPLMINTNKDLDKGRGSGTLCWGIGIKLKKGTKVKSKIWDGKTIPTVSIDSVEYMLCEHHKDSIYKIKTFKIYPEKESVKINLKMFGNIITIGGVSITQFPVNSNIATTGHKLQGMSKDFLIVHSWNYTFPNWVYVVLSRVRSLNGLFLCEKLTQKNHLNVMKTY